MKTQSFIVQSVAYLLTLLLTGCESCTCPPNVKLGDVRMKNPNFFPFKGGESFTFINKYGQTMVFNDVSENQYPNHIIVSSLCTKAPISNQYTYYEGTPAYNLTYQAKYQISTLTMHYNYQTYDAYQVPDTVLYDSFGVQISNNSNSDRWGISVVTSTRGNDVKLKLKEYADFFNDNVTISKDTLIANTVFQKVYSDKRDPKLLYTEKHGIVAFFFLSDWWYLKI